MADKQSLVLGGGCFWCLDAAYRQLKGVGDVISGYAGGVIENPSYDQVCSGQTGHAEVVQVSFDPTTITLEDILDVFWMIHDPTTLNRQGNDVGNQYRSIVLYGNEDQKLAIEKSRDKAKSIWGNKIVTEILPLEKFYPAENYHQDFFENHPEKAYCQIIINPKLKKIREKFSQLLK